MRTYLAQLITETTPLITETIPYLGLAIIYAATYRKTREGAHAPHQTYLASSFFYLLMALKALL